MTVSQDKLNKVRLLIKKAQGTDNPHEAAAFMNKAQAMMVAEGVDMQAVEMTQIGESRVKSKFTASKPAMHEATLMHAVCEAFGCKLLWIGAVTSEMTPFGKVRYSDSYGRFVIVGSKDRLNLATYAAEVLQRQMVKARTEFVQKRSTAYWDVAIGENFGLAARDIRENKELKRLIRKQVTKDADSFASGWAWKIREKVTKFALNDQEQLLLDGYKNDIPKAETKKRELGPDFHKGVAAAERADLHRPVEDSVLTPKSIGAA